MKTFKYLIFASILFLSPLPCLLGQVVNPATINVGEITDEQIKRLMQEMERNNLSEDEAIALARARGFSQSQINALRQRMAAMQQPVVSVTPPSDIEPTAVIGVSAKAAYQPSVELTKIFGFDLFNTENLTFEPSINIPTPKDYTLGIGDELVINIWGASQQTYQLTVNKSGAINIPDLGPVSVSGLPFEAASARIESRLTNIYSGLASDKPNTYAQISLGRTRSIKVNVLGEVNVPGTYTIPATASAFNALYLSGGPNERGSFRNIEIIRDNAVVKVIDVYDFLINGNSEANYPLRDQDIIMIKPYQIHVTLEGEFRRIGIYEVLDNETIKDLLLFAGGFSSQAYTSRLELNRITDKEKEIRDVMDLDFNTFRLQDGDMLRAGPVVDRYTNRVSINGAVMRPGFYELTEGLTLKDLIDNAEGLREDAYTDRGVITRRKETLELTTVAFNVIDILTGTSVIKLQNLDQVTISSINDIRQNQTIRVYGEVINPGVYAFADSMTLKDLIFKAGGLTEAASGSFLEVARRLDYNEAEQMTDQSSHIFQFNIGRDLALSAEDSKFFLKPFDQVFIFKAPSFTTSNVVSIRGEVKYAGNYYLQKKNERISEILKRAGGLTEEAYPEGAMLTRRIQLNQREKRLREDLLARNTTLEFSDLGFDIVGIDLAAILKGNNTRKDIILEDGDELIIPKELQIVKISGNVLNPISTTYKKGSGVKHYIQAAGGFDYRSRKNSVYVIYPSGTANMTQAFLLRKYPKVYPGSEIVVPQKPEREPLPATAWIAIANGMIGISVSIATLVSLTR